MPPKTESDVVILASNIHPGTIGITWARETFTNNEVVYVPGNHEYYGQALPQHTSKLKEMAQSSNLHVLENDALVKGEIVFLGCTL